MRFQFLLGSLKTLRCLEGIYGRLWGFQFLLGSLKTHTRDSPVGPDHSVSIPLRKPKNGGGWRPRNYGEEFQFLLGSLKTETWRRARIHGRKFQFLLGSLKTWPLGQKGDGMNQVSIPLRKPKNQALDAPSADDDQGFNSS